MRNAIVIVLLLMVLTVSCSSRQERCVTVGMSVQESLNALTDSSARETLVYMLPPAPGKDQRCFELADRRLVCLETSGQLVVGINVCKNPDDFQAHRVWAKVDALEL